jgi:CheY-like chemotaxis protein
VVTPASRLVLVVDDQPDERNIQRTMLTHLGYPVHEAGDGESALQAAHEHAPALVLLDVAMPRMDGFEVCRALRADPAMAGTRVVLLTASLLSEFAERAREAGADAILGKPVDPREVAETVSRLIGAPD